MNTATKSIKRVRRHKRIRAKVRGTAGRPRLCVFKSNRTLYGQIINDSEGITLASVKTSDDKNLSPKERAFKAGAQLAEIAKKKDIGEVVFDRGGFVYIGSIQSFAEGAREGGLSF